MSETTDEIKHFDMDDFLAHFGRKGMKWGVRNNDRSSSTDEHGVVVKIQDGKGVRGTSGGKHLPASQDAIRTASIKQVAKSSTLHALSNKEISEAVKRIKLEQDWHKVNQPSGLKQFVKALIFKTGKTEITELAKGGQGPVIKQIDALLKTDGKHRAPKK